MRLLTLLADFFVIYHAKGLKITDPAEEKSEKKTNKKNKNKNAIFVPKSLTKTENNENEQEKSASLPKNSSSLIINQAGHRRSLSRDYNIRQTSNNNNDATIWRKSSHHIAGLINEY